MCYIYIYKSSRYVGAFLLLTFKTCAFSGETVIYGQMEYELYLWVAYGLIRAGLDSL
jgi:hypothetical protein